MSFCVKGYLIDENSSQGNTYHLVSLGARGIVDINIWGGDLKLQHYEITQNPGEAWYGYRRIGCPKAVREALKRESQIAESKGCISEREYEVDCFLSILADIKRLHINLIEAGAGWGEWSMAMAGVVEKKVIPISAEDYFAIGVEGDYDFYQQMERSFRCNHVAAEAIYGVVSNNVEDCLFNTGFISKNCCGGSISFDGTFKGSKSGARLLGLSNLLFGKSNRVQQFTVDWLVKRYHMDCLEILHVDVQGAECLVLEGAEETIKNGLVDYILIGTHAPSLHSKVKAMLTNSHDIIAEAMPNNVNHIEGVPPVWIPKGQDGLILLKRRQ